MTGLDAAVIAITLTSGLLAMVRGFVREVLSIIAWAAAAIGALLALPYFAPVLADFISPAWLAQALAAFTVFIIILIPGTWITFRMGERVPDGHVGALDRTGGFLFGLARGFILVVIAYLFFAYFVEREDYPGWVRNARLLPLVSATGDMLKNAFGSEGDRVETSLLAPDEARRAAADSRPADGYNADERRRLDQLIERSVEDSGSN